MFNWLFSKFKKKTVDDIISESFLEEGRWKELSVNSWTDTRTGAVLTSHRRGMSLNGVLISNQVHNAFWNTFYTVPREAEEAAKMSALGKLYGHA